MMSERTTLIRLAALCLALAPLPAAFAYSETDLATLEETGSCSGCDLAGADLYEADLFQANLLGADLREADLTAADLTLADLRGVDLRGAILEETNLSGANLTAALLDKDALAGAVFDSERTRTTLGFKDLKLGMNAVEVAQYCSIEAVTGYLAEPRRDNALEGTCFDNADMPFAFKFSSGTTTGVLNFLQVGLAPYTKKGHRKFIDLLAKKYDPARSYSAQDVETFNNNREWDIKRLHTIFAGGQVTLSVVGEGAGLQMLLSYRDIEHGQRFLKLKGGPAPVDLAHLPPITTDLYKLVGNYKLKGIGAKGASTNHGRIDTAYLEIDAFENELAGELVISGHGMSGRFRIIGIETISGNRLTVQLEPVTGTIPDGRPLRMSLEFAEDGDSFTGKWTNWFNKSRRPDDFKGSRSQSFWQTAMSHNRIDMYQAYLRLRPGGIYSAVARSRITALGGTLAAPSAPTVSVAVTAAPSTPTTTITTPVDPLVGVWKFAPADGVGWGYFIVGMDDQDRLAGFQWQNVHSETFGFRETTIKPLADESYSWHSDQSISLVNPSFAMGDAADGGKFWVSENENDLPTVTSSKELFLQWRGLPPRQTLQKIALEDALALELPPEVPQGFPSPFATEGPQVASVPKAAASASAAPSIPTTTTTAVDPLVGIWTRASGFHGDCHFIVGQRDDGTLTALAFQKFLRRNVIGNDSPIEWGLTDDGVGILARAISIKRTPKGTYSWQSSDNFQALGLPGFMANPPKKGSLSISKDKDGNPRITSNRLCVEDRAQPSTATYRKLPLNEAIAMELPSIAQKDFPSPFATEGPQVASVPKAAASASAAPSIPTTTTTAVDPLVGIWVRTGSDIAWTNECWLLVGQTEDGILIGKAQDSTRKHRGNFSDKGKNIHLQDGYAFGLKEISFERQSKMNYLWSSKSNPFKSESSIDPAMSGRISIQLNEQGSDYLVSKGLLCRKRQSQSLAKFRRLTITEALELTLHPDLLKDFPSPFVTEGPQVAGVPKASASASTSPSTSVTPTATTTTATVVDPLVGIWHWQGGMWGFADSCYLAVGINDQGVLVGKSWETHQQTHLDVFFTAEEIIGSNIVGVRDITIGQINTGSYTWKTEETLQSPGEYWTKGGLTGKLHLNTQDQNVESLHVNNRICRKMRSESKNSRFKKLPLEEALALELPPELLEGFPSPFATQGPQVASVPKASASTSPSTPTTTTATVVDPLVGIWHWAGGVFGNVDNCYLAVGISDGGALKAKAWETHRRDDLLGPFIGEQVIGHNIVGVRDISIIDVSGGTYNWQSIRPIPAVNGGAAGNIWSAADMAGRVHIDKGSDVNQMTANNRLCRKLHTDSKSGHFRKLPLEDALALELPPELLQGFPSPFQDGTRWSGDAVATEPIQAAKDQDTTSKTDGSDTR